MVWIPIGAWLAALLIAVLVLGFLAYELTWKAGRLISELGRLHEVEDQLAGVHLELAAAADRLARSGRS